MRISIALATYNGERYLREQLESFASQSRLPDELVVCDDGSSDTTVEILERFAAKAPFPVKIHRNLQNLGYVGNFGKAIALAGGDLVFLSDQDDIWCEGKLAKFEERALTEPRGLLFVCDAWLCDASGNAGVRYSDNLAPFGTGTDQIVIGCCTALRQEFIPLLLPLANNGMSHDVWMHLVANAIGEKAVIDKPLQLYRRHEVNNTSNLTHALGGHSALSRWRISLRAALRDPVSHWQEQLLDNKLVLSRLKERIAEFAQLIGRDRIDQAISEVSDHIEALEARISIVKASHIDRIPSVLRHYRSGGYARHRGLVSALKDFVRPKSRFCDSEPASRSDISRS